ncbi:uncharacterized protein [Montipora foliosa]|uniref:uncharacterized protein n=1 Tax=Montipora foliosa TaxID=591990 RepID=UPI0035F1FBFC
MAAEEIPGLLPEVIEKIALFLPLPEVTKCMLVCKEWKVLLSSEQFCKRYVYSQYDLEVEEQASGMLKMWSDRSSWFCYWANYEEPDAWVFSVVPRRWKCGVVHLADYELKTHTDLKYRDFLRALFILQRIQKAAEPDELLLDCAAWGNEGCGPIDVCLFPWSKATLPTSEEICSMFKFHPQMHKNPMVRHKIGELKVETKDKSNDGDVGDDNDENSGKVIGHVRWNKLHTSYHVDVRKASRFFRWLEEIFTPMVLIGIGCDQMNPIPTFMLAHIAPGWVGGILSFATCT